MSDMVRPLTPKCLAVEGTRAFPKGAAPSRDCASVRDASIAAEQCPPIDIRQRADTFGGAVRQIFNGLQATVALPVLSRGRATPGRTAQKEGLPLGDLPSAPGQLSYVSRIRAEPESSAQDLCRNCPHGNRQCSPCSGQIHHGEGSGTVHDSTVRLGNQGSGGLARFGERGLEWRDRATESG